MTPAYACLHISVLPSMKNLSLVLTSIKIPILFLQASRSSFQGLAKHKDRRLGLAKHQDSHLDLAKHEDAQLVLSHKTWTAEITICIISEKKTRSLTARSPSTVTERLRSRTRWKCHLKSCWKCHVQIYPKLSPKIQRNNQRV